MLKTFTSPAEPVVIELFAPYRERRLQAFMTDEGKIVYLRIAHILAIKGVVDVTDSPSEQVIGFFESRLLNPQVGKDRNGKRTLHTYWMNVYRALLSLHRHMRSGSLSTVREGE
jgi:hypothetical protein